MAGKKKSTKAEAKGADKWEKIAEQAMQEEDQVDDSEFEKPTPNLGLATREELEAQLNELEIKVGEFKDKAIRAHAELENVRRRAERDVESAHKFGSERLLQALIPIMDSLTRGLEGATPDDAQYEGMRLTLDMFEKTLQKFGVVTIDPAQGEAFNPDQQEAMTMQEDPEAESNTVLQVLQKGYLLHGRVLKAAMVIVAK